MNNIILCLTRWCGSIAKDKKKAGKIEIAWAKHHFRYDSLRKEISIWLGSKLLVLKHKMIISLWGIYVLQIGCYQAQVPQVNNIQRTFFMKALANVMSWLELLFMRYCICFLLLFEAWPLLYGCFLHSIITFWILLFQCMHVLLKCLRIIIACRQKVNRIVSYAYRI